MPKGKRWKTFQTVADGSKAAICGAVGGCECATGTRRHRVIDTHTMDGGALQSCGVTEGADRVQQTPSTSDEDDEEPQTIG